MWVLTVIIYVGVHVYSGATGVTIPGFKSRVACDLAAKEVTSQIKRADIEALCLFVGGGKVAAPPVLPVPPVPAPASSAAAPAEPPAPR